MLRLQFHRTRVYQSCSMNAKTTLLPHVKAADGLRKLMIYARYVKELTVDIIAYLVELHGTVSVE